MSGFQLLPLFVNLTVTVLVCVALLVAFAVGAGVYVRHAIANDATTLDWVRRGLIALCLCAACLGPSQVIHTNTQAVNGTDVFFAVDVTGSMAVKDATYGSETTVTRLSAARSAVNDITGQYAGASFAAVSFGTGASLDVPLTPDTHVIRNWSDKLSEEPTGVSSGSSLDAGLDTLIRAMQQAHKAHPNNIIVLYFISDGENTSTSQRRTFTTLRTFVQGGAVLGTGSSTGGQVPLIETSTSGSTSVSKDSNGTQQWVTDPSTKKPAISKLDAGTLKDIADETSTEYIQLDKDTTSSSFSAKISHDYSVLTTHQKRTTVVSFVWPFAIALFALLVWEFARTLYQRRRYL